MYLMLTGKVPFEGPRFQDVLQSIDKPDKIFEELKLSEEIFSMIDSIFMID